ncbi:MAG: hypothetical protein K2Y21_04725 [Phycisphaerales bacterium]|nr:hypothetical protein [Phycisphaerales bacterium]
MAIPAPPPRGPSNACDWVDVQAAAKSARRQVQAVIEEATLVEHKDGRVTIRVSPDLRTAAEGARDAITEVITRVWQRSVTLTITTPEVASTSLPGGLPVGALDPSLATSNKAGPSPNPAAVPAVPTGQGIPSMTVSSAAEHPLIARAVELLNAKVLGVYPRQTRPTEPT